MTNLIEFIETINKLSTINIEYAVIEKTLSTNFEKLEQTLHLIYTPNVSSILNNYVSGSSIEAVSEVVYNEANVYSFFNSITSDSTSRILLPKILIFPEITKLVVSNMARFCNFNLLSSSDPFFSMFFEEQNIIWKSRDFDTFFFKNKEAFLPSKYTLAVTISQVIYDIKKELSEVMTRYSYREKITSIYCKLQNIVKLYLIILNYIKTDILSSALNEEDKLILATLDQAAKPFAFLTNCYSVLEKEIRNLSNIKTEDTSKILKSQALNFLQYKVCEEINPLYIHK